MITEAEVDAAVESARQELRDGAEVAWIRESALHARAYYLGLYFGLQAIASHSDLKRFFLQAIADTMFARKGDDPFTATHIGRAVSALKDKVLDPASAAGDTRAAADAVGACIEQSDRYWSWSVGAARHALAAVRECCERDEAPGSQATDREADHAVHDRLNALERAARLLPLVDPDKKDRGSS